MADECTDVRLSRIIEPLNAKNLRADVLERPPYFGGVIPLEGDMAGIESLVHLIIDSFELLLCAVGVRLRY
jgi:hypothetical protein